MNRKTGRKLLCWLSILAVMAAACGCSSTAVSADAVQPQKPASETKTVMMINNRPVTDAEVCIYLYLMQKPYEMVYGSDIWQEQREDGTTWEDWLLEEVKHQIIELEILSSRAEQEGMSLTDDERASVDEDADTAFESMSDAAGRYGITREAVENVYEKSQLAGIYYQTVTEGYGLSLSEEELSDCRAVTVQQIFIAENDSDHLEEGQTQEQLAEQILNRALKGENFETLAKAYSSEDAQWTLSFDQEGYVFDTDGWLEQDFVEAAWNLEESEISPVIHTSYGYHILRCTAKDSEELKQQAENNELKKKREQRFADDYDNWLLDVICTEEPDWEEMHALEGI